MIYAMFGAVDKCYNLVPISTPGSCAEFNVAQNITAAQQTIAAAWPLTIIPLDACAITMNGEPWQRLQAASQAGHFIAQVLLESLNVWSNQGYPVGCPTSDFLYDVVALYTSYSQAHFGIEELQLSVTDTGATVRDSLGKPISVVSKWISNAQKGFLRDLAE